MIDFDLIEKNDKIVCGLSGGADSIALVYALKMLEQKFNIQVFACHLNHKTRSEESTRDLLFAENFCKTYNIPFYFEEIDIIVDKQKGFEATARQIRYDFFDRACKFFNANKIATAHNCDDNLETIIMNISRGCGLSGLCGIPCVRGNIIRPILKKTRFEIEDFLKSQNLDFITDSSNNTDDYTRNKIRHHILPVLQDVNTKSSQNAYIMSQSAKIDDVFLYDLANKTYENLVVYQNFSYILNINELTQLNLAISYRVLNIVLSKFNIVLGNSNFKKIIDICNSNNQSFYLDLYKGIEIFREYDTIIFRAKIVTNDILKLELNKNDIIILTNMFCNLNFCIKTDFNLIDFSSLFIRYKQVGDKLSYSFGSKSIKKLFIEKKIPKNSRQFVPILCDKNGIIGVCFLGTDFSRTGNNTNNIIFRSINNEK